MINLLILDNEDSFSHNLRHLLLTAGADKVDVVSTADYNKELLAFYQGVVLSPGPGLPDDHQLLKVAIQDAQASLPIWGVCLGHQAIAEVFGGELIQLPLVFHGIKSEVIISDKTGLWQGINHPDLVGRYHSWMVAEKHFPADLMITSRDTKNRIMSLRHRSLPIFGVQFHPESYMTNQGELMARNFIVVVQRHSKSSIL